MWDATGTLALGMGAVMGSVLAFTGAGGGILAIPLLMLGLGLPMQQAAPIGLAAVGLASALGAWLGLRQGMVRYRAALLIGATGMVFAPVGVALAQRLPAAPLILGFSGILVFNAVRMLRRQSTGERLDAPCRINPHSGRLRWTAVCARQLAMTGGFSGLLSGMLGVGGGFVIIPSLSKHTDLDLRSIQLTAMAVIALVSVSGVVAAVLHGNWVQGASASFVLGALAGLWVCKRWADRANPALLRKGFAMLCLLVAAVMLARLDWHGGWF